MSILPTELILRILEYNNNNITQLENLTHYFKTIDPHLHHTLEKQLTQQKQTLLLKLKNLPIKKEYPKSLYDVASAHYYTASYLETYEIYLEPTDYWSIAMYNLHMIRQDQTKKEQYDHMITKSSYVMDSNGIIRKLPSDHRYMTLNRQNDEHLLRKVWHYYNFLYYDFDDLTDKHMIRTIMTTHTGTV